MWEQTLSLHHSLLKRNSFLLFFFCRFGASILFFCWFGLQKTCEMNIINTIIFLTSDARARPLLCTFSLFSESFSSPSPHVYFSFPFSLPFIFSQKRMDLKNLRCRKVKKKKKRCGGGGHTSIKKKMMTIFCSLTREIRRNFHVFSMKTLLETTIKAF